MLHDQDGDRETDPRAHAIDEPAREQQPDRIGELEAEDDVGVVDLAPAVLLLQRRLEDADHLAIDVVDGRGQEQQAADHPAVPARCGATGAGPTLGGARFLSSLACAAPAVLVVMAQMVGLRRWIANSRWPSRSADVGLPEQTARISSSSRSAALSIDSD